MVRANTWAGNLSPTARPIVGVVHLEEGRDGGWVGERAVGWASWELRTYVWGREQAVLLWWVVGGARWVVGGARVAVGAPTPTCGSMVCGGADSCRRRRAWLVPRVRSRVAVRAWRALACDRSRRGDGVAVFVGGAAPLRGNTMLPTARALPLTCWW